MANHVLVERDGMQEMRGDEDRQEQDDRLHAGEQRQEDELALEIHVESQAVHTLAPEDRISLTICCAPLLVPNHSVATTHRNMRSPAFSATQPIITADGQGLGEEEAQVEHVGQQDAPLAAEAGCPASSGTSTLPRGGRGVVVRRLARAAPGNSEAALSRQ